MGERLIDTRFTTKCDDIEDLVKTVDIDDVDDLETLLMFLLGRPVRVHEAWDDDNDAVALDVRVFGNELVFAMMEQFPLSVTEIARDCAEMAQELGPYTVDGWTGESPDLSEFSDDELIPALRDALGKVRVFNLLED